MSFNKRFISKESIKAKSKDSFERFESYLMNADVIISECEWSSKIYSLFSKYNKEDRIELQKQIANNLI